MLQSATQTVNRTACLVASLSLVVVAPVVAGQSLSQQAIDDERPPMTLAPSADGGAAPHDAGAPVSPPGAAPLAGRVLPTPGVAPAAAPTLAIAPTPAPVTPPGTESSRPSIDFTGYAEFYLSYNFNAPSNGVNALRLFDSRHDHIGFNNLSFTLDWNVDAVQGHVVTQFGAILTEGYEPATTLDRVQQELLWRVLQEVTIGWAPKIGERRPLVLEGGLFVAPLGVEYVQIYKNWNWSPSNLFYISPFQMTGVRASWSFDEQWRVRAGLYSGWDAIVEDNNSFRTVLLQGEYTVDDDTFASVQYMMGVERDRGAVEGQWVRHTLDLYGGLRFSDAFQMRAHVLGGVEPNRLGVSAWLGAALYARVRFASWLFAAVRGDLLHEWVPTNSESLFGFGDVGLHGSGTVTLEALPHRHLSLRLEYRHDHANGVLYFRDNPPTLPRMPTAALPNTTWQDTLCLGATAWF